MKVPEFIDTYLRVDEDNADRLAAESLVFDRAYVQYSYWVDLEVVPTRIRFPLLIWPALGIFLMAYLLIYRKPGSGSTGYEKKWRGKVIEERKSGLERIKDWFRS